MRERLESKRRAAREAMNWVEDGMTLGLGTGSTAAMFVELLGEAVQKGLRVRGVPTSTATEKLALNLGIQLIDLEEVDKLDLTVDGADEITPQGLAIKGGGGALCREKIVATATSGIRIAVVDESKVVEQVGEFPLPVEVVPFARPLIEREIRVLGGEPEWRRAGGEPVITDNGNYLLDCRFGRRNDWPRLAGKLDSIPGVVCHGIFLNVFEVILIGSEEGVKTLRLSERAVQGESLS